MEKENNSWMPYEQYVALKELENEFVWAMVWGAKKRIPQEDDNIKLAWVVINGKNEMLGVDNITMKGYKMNTDIPTVKLPLEEQKYDEFVRWCTTFDL